MIYVIVPDEIFFWGILRENISHTKGPKNTCFVVMRISKKKTIFFLKIYAILCNDFNTL